MIILFNMKKYLLLSIYLMLNSVALFAVEKGKQYEYFRTGVYVSVDLSAGKTFNERMNSSYGIDIAAGYRFCPQFVVAAGFGGHAYSNTTATCGGTVVRNVETTSVPVFIRLRSDILDKKVSPYVQLDIGYSFVFLYSRDALGLIKYNDKVFMNRVYDMGFSTLEDYESYFRQNVSGNSASVDAQWAAELERLKNFSNGKREYITYEDVHVQYGKNGLFGNLELGVGWDLSGVLRMNLGILAGLSQSYYGTCLRTLDNEFLHFGRMDTLPRGMKDSPIYVRTLGQKDFKDSFEFDLKVKIGFTF